MVNAQEYIKQFNRELKILDLEGQELEDYLDLSEFTVLEELNCSRNELTSLDVSKCKNLKKIDCSYNLFDDLEFLTQLPSPEKLVYLNIEENGAFVSLEERLKMLVPFINLEKTEEEKVIESLIDQLNQLKENKEQLEKEINSLKERNFQLGEKITEQKEELVKYKASLQTSQSSLQELEVKKNNLESKLREKQKETEFLQENKKKLQVEISEFQEKFQQLIVKFDAEKDDALLNKELQIAKENIERLEKELAQAEEDLENNQEQILNLQKELLDKNKEIKKVQAEKQIETDSLQTEKDKLQLEFSALKNKLESNKKELKQKKQELSETKRSLEKEKLSKSIELTKELRKQEEKLKKETKKIKDKNERLEKKLAEKNQQIITIDEDIKSSAFQVKPNLKRLLGKGGYGEVYYGEWKSQEVAVKKLSIHNTSESDFKDIQGEIIILKNLRNRYIIQYYGTYSDEQELFIIMDYAENGTLTKFINDNKDKEHDWNFNSELIKQIALGLAYIHHEKVIHRDLKSMNILLTNNYQQVKISDFGLSRVKTVSSTQTKGAKGTLRWIAPELLKGQRYSEQSDIYALGMVIWEIVAKCTTPFEDIDNNLLGFHIANGVKETIPNDVPKNIHDIIQQCWKDEPNERTNLVNVLKIIGANESEFQTISDDDESLDTENLSKTQTGEVFGASQSLKIDFAEYNQEAKESEEEIQVQAQIQIPPK